MKDLKDRLGIGTDYGTRCICLVLKSTCHKEVLLELRITMRACALEHLLDVARSLQIVEFIDQAHSLDKLPRDWDIGPMA